MRVGCEGRWYNSYYASINPWIRAWSRTPPGVPILASKHFPPSRFANTEFYNDWLAPQKKDSAAGIKVLVGRRSQMHVPIHYPGWLQDRYDGPASKLLGLLHGNLRRAVSLARQIQGTSEKQIAAASLVCRFDQAALIIDQELRIHDLNSAAELLLTDSFVIAGPASRLSLRNSAALQWLRRVVATLSSGIQSEDSGEYVLVDNGKKWKFTISALPQANPSLGPLLSYRRLALFLISDLTPQGNSTDLSALARAYGLTSSETRLLDLLAGGKTLQEATADLNLTRESGRDRMKKIFQKLEVNRQAELIRLLALYSR